VKTVVQMRYTQQEVGRYLGGGRALKVTVNVTVIDRASRVVLGTRTFTGADPPTVTVGNSSDDVRGAVAYGDIISYLKQLRKGS
jgi:hypothetical protein